MYYYAYKATDTNEIARTWDKKLSPNMEHLMTFHLEFMEMCNRLEPAKSEDFVKQLSVGGATTSVSILEDDFVVATFTSGNYSAQIHGQSQSDFRGLGISLITLGYRNFYPTLVYTGNKTEVSQMGRVHRATYAKTVHDLYYQDKEVASSEGDIITFSQYATLSEPKTSEVVEDIYYPRLGWREIGSNIHHRTKETYTYRQDPITRTWEKGKEQSNHFGKSIYEYYLPPLNDEIQKLTVTYQYFEFWGWI